MEPILQRTYILDGSQATADGFCRPEALLQRMQEATTQHSDAIGIGRDVMLQEHNGIWMLARCWYQLTQPLVPGMAITLQTWPCKNTATSSERYFAFYADGKRIGQALQMWVLADIDKRRICRIDQFAEICAMPLTEKPISLRLRRLPRPMLQDAGAYTIVPADIDENGHMNNVRYLRCAMQPFADTFVWQLQINYEHECRVGQTLHLQSAVQDDTNLIFGLLEDGSVSFELQIWQNQSEFEPE